MLLVVVTPALDENSSSHFETPTFPPVTSCLHEHIWEGSSGFSQKRQNLGSRLWSPKLSPRCSPVTAAVYSHSQVGDCFRGDPVALVLGWNWTGMEINGRDNLPPTAWTLCVRLGCGAGRFLQRNSSELNFLKGIDGYLTGFHWTTDLLQSPAHWVFLTFWISLLKRTLHPPSACRPSPPPTFCLPLSE